MDLTKLTSSPVITRCPANPVLASKQVPWPSTLAYNAGVIKFQGRYVMVFRSENASPEKLGMQDTVQGLAFSDDGVHWQVEPAPCFSMKDEEICRAYDPRLIVIEGRVYMCFAVDTRHGLRGGIAVTDDFEHWEVLHQTLPDNRNLVLFPERIGGLYVRLERPFSAYMRWHDPESYDVWLSRSPDMRYWGDSELVLPNEKVAFANNKIGPGPQPIKTPVGWLTFFHATDDLEGRNWGWSGKWNRRYTVGVVLLDLEDPGKIVGYCPHPVLVPEPPYDYETEGMRSYVAFPCGAILEDDGEVKLYYGASDTVVALATAHVDDLIKLCV